MGENRDGTPERPPCGYWSMHPQMRLGYEILPYLRELDDHEPEERAFLEQEERRAGRAAGGVGEAPLGRAGARMIGDL